MDPRPEDAPAPGEGPGAPELPGAPTGKSTEVGTAAGGAPEAKPTRVPRKRASRAKPKKPPTEATDLAEPAEATNLAELAEQTKPRRATRKRAVKRATAAGEFAAPVEPPDASPPTAPAEPAPAEPAPPKRPRAPRPSRAKVGTRAKPTASLQLADRVPEAPVRVPTAKVTLSTSSAYPESVAAAFEIARRLGYDGVELMVFTDPVSQDADAVRSLSEYYGVPVLSVHAPCLLVTQRVWSTDPWEKLRRAQAAAERLGASTVVVHPPFRWQRDYGRDFELGLARMRDETDVVFAVENMYPWRARNREWAAYLPDWDPRNQDYPQVTLDLSHTAVSGTDALAMADDLGDRLAHVHLADGSGLARDEHLVPGRGTQQCDRLLERLAANGFSGTIAVEVSTRKATNRAEREADLAEALAFARLHLAAPVALTAPSKGSRP